MQYVAGIATLTALTVSALFWFVERVRTTFFSTEKVVVAACNTLDTGAIIVNRGDREVFVSHLTLWMTGRASNWIAPVLQINERLEPGQFIRRTFPPGKIVGAGTFIRGLSSDEFEKLIVRASNNDPCVEADFFVLSDSMLNDLTSSAGPTLNTFPVNGYVEYWGSGGKAVRVSISGLGVIREAVLPCPVPKPNRAD